MSRKSMIVIGTIILIGFVSGYTVGHISSHNGLKQKCVDIISVTDNIEDIDKVKVKDSTLYIEFSESFRKEDDITSKDIVELKDKIRVKNVQIK